MSRIIFLGSISIILIAISYITARSYSSGLRLDTVATRIVSIVFFLIPILFIGSILLARNGTIGAVLYREIQIIAGVGLYVFFGAVVLGICLLIAKVAGVVLPTWSAWSILVISLIVAAIGLIQAHSIKVTRYSITLPDAPMSWNNQTAILLSDTHFGLVNHERFSEKIVDAIIALDPDLVLHAGDFYDGPVIDTAPISANWKRLAAATPVFMAPGNHEEYGNYAGFLDSLRAANITVLDNKFVSLDGVQIAGITYHSGKDPESAHDALASLGLDTRKPSILINHPPTSLAAASSTGVDLQVSGHTHNGQLWPIKYLVRRIYGRYSYGLQSYEQMKVITTSGVGTFGPPLRLGNTPELVLITFNPTK
jgi:predicted MPP superfamily phosphohydrolase